MNVYYSGNDKKILKLIREPLFLKIASFLAENQEREIILRELESRFNDADLEKVVEKMVEYKIIERKDRRYRLLLPYIKEWPKLEEPSNMADLSKSEVVHYLDSLAELLPKDCFFFTNFSFPQRTVLGNQEFQLLTFSQDLSPQTLPNYFFAKEQGLLNMYPDLTELLGDVEKNYFSDQIEMILQKIQDGKMRLKRRNIFYEALEATKVISEDQQVLIMELAATARTLNETEELKNLDPIKRTVMIQMAIRELLAKIPLQTVTYYKKISAN